MVMLTAADARPSESRDAVDGAEIDIARTPTYKAIEHWAKVAPDRTAVIYTGTTWKVRKGSLLERSVEPSEWKRISYKGFHNRVTRLRDALYYAGVPKTKTGGYRVMILYLPKCRIDFMAMIIACQATGCVPLFARPKALGGLRSWARTMLSLQPDAILCSRAVRFLFHCIAATISTSKGEKKLRWLNGPALVKAAHQTSATPPSTTENDIFEPTLETPIANMFSSGTTGPPTPIIITHRMQGFRTAAYAEMLRQQLVTNSTGALTDEECGGAGTRHETAVTSRDGPWISCHFSSNLVLMDISLGGTAVLHPMGLAQPALTVCPVTFKNIIHNFHVQVTSGPPALWKRMQDTCPEGSLQSLKVAFVGGAETSASFTRASCKLLGHEESSLRDCGFFRIYGTTQVLPIAFASASMILDDEEKSKVCALGGGVCLGPGVEGLDLGIDTAAWEAKGGRSKLDLPWAGTVNVGELCVMGKALSPSLEVSSEVGQGSKSSQPPTYIFHSGDVCYIDPDSGNVYLLGRMAQAVYCGESLKLVPAAGIEMVCVESKVVSRCAFVGPSIDGQITPTLVLESGDVHSSLSALKEGLRAAFKRSAWSELLNTGIRFTVYNKSFPVDDRHSSKVNRLFLRDWVAKISSEELYTLGDSE